MNTNIEFRTSKFPPYDGEEDEVNPGRWGKRLAEYLSAKLNSEGIETKMIYSEDWGWVIPIKNDEFPIWIGCGNHEEYPDAFLCFIESSKSIIQKLFKKMDTTEKVNSLSQSLEKILTSDPEIFDVKWLKE